MRRIGWVIGLTTLVLAGVYYIGDPAQDESIEKQVVAEAESVIPEPANVPSGEVSGPEAERHERSGFWLLPEIEDSWTLPAIRDDVQNARLAGFDRHQIGALQKGDVMTIPIPQTNRSYLVNVTAVKTTKNGNKVIRGRIDGTLNGSIFTLGKSGLFATVGTPDGIFNVNGHDSLAWIVEARELNHHVDPDVRDYVSAIASATIVPQAVSNAVSTNVSIVVSHKKHIE